jgi:hypothetical protein
MLCNRISIFIDFNFVEDTLMLKTRFIIIQVPFKVLVTYYIQRLSVIQGALAIYEGMCGFTAFPSSSSSGGAVPAFLASSNSFAFLYSSLVSLAAAAAAPPPLAMLWLICAQGYRMNFHEIFNLYNDFTHRF